MPNFTPVDDKDQLPDLRQAEQQLAHKGQVIAFIIHTLILDPATVAFDPAVSFGMIRCFASNAGQLTTLALHNATDHRRQCTQHACLIPLRFCRKQLPHRYSNGTIDPTIVIMASLLFFLGRKNIVYLMWQSSSVKVSGNQIWIAVFIRAAKRSLILHYSLSYLDTFSS